MTQHDTSLSLDAERRSIPATPELTLTDAVEWMKRDGMVPEEHITGIVEQGNVYDVATVRTEWASCVCTDGRHVLEEIDWAPFQYELDEDEHRLRRVVAVSTAEVAQ